MSNSQTIQENNERINAVTELLKNKAGGGSADLTEIENNIADLDNRLTTLENAGGSGGSEGGIVIEECGISTVVTRAIELGHKLLFVELKKSTALSGTAKGMKITTSGITTSEGSTTLLNADTYVRFSLTQIATTDVLNLYQTDEGASRMHSVRITTGGAVVHNVLINFSDNSSFTCRRLNEYNDYSQRDLYTFKLIYTQ